MSWLNFGIIIVAFAVLYKVVIPRLFPEVISGQQKLKVEKDLPNGHPPAEYTVQHGGMSLFGANGAEKRSHLRARRRANADGSSV